MNHLFPPFNDVRARRAVLMAMSQEDYMRAIVGDDDKLWRPLPGFFTPNRALYRRGRRHPQGAAQVRCGQEAARGNRLFRPAGHLPRRPGPADHQGAGRRHRRSPQAARHERRFRSDRLGHRRRPPRPEEPARPGRLGMFHTWHAGADPSIRRPITRSAATATRRGSAGPTCRMSRPRSMPGSTPRTSTTRRRRSAASTKPRSTTSSTRRPASSSLPGMAQERHRHREGAVAVLLGCRESVRRVAVRDP